MGLERRRTRLEARASAFLNVVGRLEPLLEVPYYLSPGWLRMDPEFAPLRGNPRFERPVAGK